ncbi:MAG: 2,3-bisphosphoglycerate-dependent phosphoglycerate mutase [Alphaproteobacteria bacterium]|nr:2,3-bisphosphoglycerate-dependent phosphoglycerate mutase [Alphaproteobacteria bacterium]
MPRTLIIVRHGESEWNANNRFTGRQNPGLTPRGEHQARNTARQLANAKLLPTRAFTSELRRARQTAEIILNTLNHKLKPVIAAELNERDYGALTGLDKEEARERFGAETVRRWRRSWDAAPPNGESLKDTAARVIPYYETYIAPCAAAGETTLLAAHGNVIRALVMHIEGLGPRSVEEVNIETGEPILYDFAADGAAKRRALSPSADRA